MNALYSLGRHAHASVTRLFQSIVTLTIHTPLVVNALSPVTTADESYAIALTVALAVAL